MSLRRHRVPLKWQVEPTPILSLRKLPEIFRDKSCELGDGASVLLEAKAELSVLFYPTCEDLMIRGGRIEIAGDKLTIGDIASSQFELYGDLPGLYRLYRTLNPNPGGLKYFLRRFRFSYVPNPFFNLCNRFTLLACFTDCYRGVTL